MIIRFIGSLIRYRNLYFCVQNYNKLKFENFFQFIDETEYFESLNWFETFCLKLNLKNNCNFNKNFITPLIFMLCQNLQKLSNI